MRILSETDRGANRLPHARRTFSWATLAIGLLVAGCPAPRQQEPDERDRASPADPAELEAERARAHRKALEIARPLAVEALTAADPWAAWERDLGPLAPPRMAVLPLAEARAKGRHAMKEVAEIEEHYLEPVDYVELATIRFALQRLERRAWSRPPSRRAPDLAVAHAVAFVDAWEAEVATDGCSDRGQGLEAAATALDEALLDLGAASVPMLRAAASDIQTLRSRIAAIGRRIDNAQPGCEAANVHLEAVISRLRTQLAALPDAQEVSWTELVPAARGKATLRRLPETLGEAALVEWFEHEEASAEEVGVMVSRLWSAIERMHKMASRTATTVSTPARTVDVPRCEAARNRLVAWARRIEKDRVPAAEAPSCAAIAALSGEQALTDAELLLAVVEHAWVRPRMRANRVQTGPAVALVGGDIAPASHVLAATVAAIAGIGDAAASRLALARARRAACRAAAALWIHGELPGRPALEARLKVVCPEQGPLAWIAEAEARPHVSFRGVGLALIEDGVASAAALDRYWWAPLGLVGPLALPPRPPPPANPADLLEHVQDL